MAMAMVMAMVIGVARVMRVASPMAMPDVLQTVMPMDTSVGMEKG
jgi:hypothetical protein